eukprot:8121859-Alexandrium_andersonii.AAC.1
MALIEQRAARKKAGDEEAVAASRKAIAKAARSDKARWIAEGLKASDWNPVSSLARKPSPPPWPSRALAIM